MCWQVICNHEAPVRKGLLVRAPKISWRYSNFPKSDSSQIVGDSGLPHKIQVFACRDCSNINDICSEVSRISTYDNLVGLGPVSLGGPPFIRIPDS